MLRLHLKLKKKKILIPISKQHKQVSNMKHCICHVQGLLKVIPEVKSSYIKLTSNSKTSDFRLWDGCSTGYTKMAAQALCREIGTIRLEYFFKATKFMYLLPLLIFCKDQVVCGLNY